MNHIVETVERIRNVYDATIGRNYVDIGRELVAPLHLEEHSRRDEAARARMRAYIKDGLSRLEELVRPDKIPDDLLFFERYYGGMALKSGTMAMVIYGCGWGENIDYPSIVEDVDGNPRYRNGWLEIGAVAIGGMASPGDTVLRAGLWADLAGAVQAEAIVTNGIYQGLEIWEDDPLALTVVAATFGAWLDRIADSHWVPFL